MENLFLTPTKALDSHYEACLSNSNPLLHPSRLFTMWSEWRPGIVFPTVGMFYEEWTDEASEVYISMDRELHQLLDVLPVRPGCLPTVLEYYESTDVASLTRKLRSIKAFHGIKMPMREAGDGNGYVPDLRSRYFTEDFPYGLDIIRATAQRHHISTPTMDRIHEWGEKMQRYATELY